MRILRLLAVALTAVLAFACARKAPAPEPARLEWTMQDVQRSWSADTADTVRDVWVSLHYPQFTRVPGGAAVTDSLNRWVQLALLGMSQSDSAPGDIES